MRPRRIPGFDYLGSYGYSLTLCTYGRRAHFTNAESVRLVRSTVLNTAPTFHFEISAYCFMPDHLHLLVRGLDDECSLTAFVTMLKQRSGHEFRKRFNVRLWQEGYFERTLRSDEDLCTVARYIEANPVRAGLVRSVGQWPHVGGTLLDERGGAEAPPY